MSVYAHPPLNDRRQKPGCTSSPRAQDARAFLQITPSFMITKTFLSGSSTLPIPTGSGHRLPASVMAHAVVSRQVGGVIPACHVNARRDSQGRRWSAALGIRPPRKRDINATQIAFQIVGNHARCADIIAKERIDAWRAAGAEARNGRAISRG